MKYVVLLIAASFVLDAMLPDFVKLAILVAMLGGAAAFIRFVNQPR